MELLNLSWSAVFKVLSGVAIAYVIAPFLLILRDLILLKIIEKWILTEKLVFNIRMSESDRWQIKSKYSKAEKIKIPNLGGETVYELDGKVISNEEYKEYKQWKNIHENRFRQLDAYVNLRHNWLVWLTKHYKLDTFKTPIPEMRKNAYEQESGKTDA